MATVYKIDLYHRDKALTFGPRFKGEVGKDIFAAKVALGLLTPISEADQDTVSYNPSIPMDQQKWFDCATGVGVDLERATKFDTVLENALLTYQINNKFLITYYYFEKYGIKNLLKNVIEEKDQLIYGAQILTELNASMSFFEGELGTLGEATIAVMHGYRPLSIVSNTSYVHDPEVYENRVNDVIPRGIYNEIIDPLYPQNLQTLEEQGIVIPESASADLPDDDVFSPIRNWWNKLTDPSLQTASISYYPTHSGNSSLYIATTKVVDYYLENNLFSQTLSQQELRDNARRALYPDPFSRTDVFVIDGTTLGFYTDTPFFLSAQGPLPSEDFETIALLEEQALIQALQSSDKPQIWNFLKDDEVFKLNYFSGQEPEFGPQHSGVYPINITTKMLEELSEFYPDSPRPGSAEFQGFKVENYWVLSTSDVTNNLEEGDNSVQYWRILEDLGSTKPLIEFKEFITPTLRPGESYRALFEINRQKFESITNGDSLFKFEESSQEDETDEPPQQACLDQSSEQSLRTYEEYKAHAIKKRRDLVREIREQIQNKSRRGSIIDLGGFDSTFSGLNIDAYTDYQMVQQLGQLLPGQELAELIGGNSESLDWLNENASPGSEKTNNPDNSQNKLSINFRELEERIEKASKDLRESAEIIKRERIRLTPGSQFDGNNEASLLARIPEALEEIEPALKSLSDKDKESVTISIDFSRVGSDQQGLRNGKEIIAIASAGAGLSIKDLPDVLKRPRTVNYLAQIKDMTFFPKLSSFFDDSRGACKDLGINIDKITGFAYITKYTSGIGVIADKEESFSFKSWWEEAVEDPIKEFGERSADNLKASWDSSNFDENAALRALGEECKIEKVWEEVFDRLDPVSLLCDYVKCLRLPAFDIKFPDFNLDPLPKIGIIGWYKGLIEFLIKNIETIIKRLACTAAKMIIDKLAFPFCQEQLDDFISSGIDSTQPWIKQALVDSLIKTGIPNKDKAKDFFDSASNILTGRELCYILAGNMPDNATMSAIQKLAAAKGVDKDLKTHEEIVNFFGVIGLYIPDEICEALNSRTVVRPTDCDDTNDLMRSIRNRLQADDSTLTAEEIDNALSLAEKNKQEEADRIKSLLENGFSGLVPPVFDYGNPDAPMADFPDFFKREQEKSAKALFSKAKSSYVQGLQQYVPAMYVSSPVHLWPYDERYDQVQVLRLEAAIQQIKDYSESLQRPVAEGHAPDVIGQFADLHSLYQVEIIKDLPYDLIPEENRRTLAPTAETQTSYTPRYVLPHQAEHLSAAGFRQTTQGVLVHKRRIVRSGEVTEEDIVAEIRSLSVIVGRYNTRVNRTSGGKRDRLRNERRPFLRRLNALKETLAEGNFDKPEVVEYEFFMAYQKNINNGNLKGMSLEFELVKQENLLCSDTVEYSNFLGPIPPFALEEDSPIVDRSQFSEAARQDAGFGDSSPGQASRSTINIQQNRLKDLNDRIMEIISARPPITDESLFPGLQKLLDHQTELSLENINLETVSTVDNNFEIKFNAGSIYSPTIILSEKTADPDKDRFDIILKGDFYLGLGREEEKKFRYCNQLPDQFTDPELTARMRSDGSFAKRFRFRNAVANSLEKIGFEFETMTRMTNFLRSTLFKSTTESLIETLLDELGDSYLFRGVEAAQLDNRVSGKRQINANCVSNRFSLGDGSVTAFNKVIIGDISTEIVKEMLKPENAPENYDFDTIPPYDLAMQNLAVKGFIRVCLIDVLLKGGLAYSVWDIEPIVGEKFFVDYVTQHVKLELESSDDLKNRWPKILERATGIASSQLALQSIIAEELPKIANYSKQVYHPQDNKTNFFNWFLEKHVPQFDVASRSDIDNGRPIIAIRPSHFNGRQIGSTSEEFKAFLSGKQQFIIEHYIQTRGNLLTREFQQALENISGMDGREIESIDNTLIMSIGDFTAAIRSLPDINKVKQLLETEQGVIVQGSRLVLVDPTPYYAQDVVAQGFDPNNPDEEPEEAPRNFFVKTILSGEDDESTLSQKSVITKSYWVSVDYSNDTAVDRSNAFAVPLFEASRALDFKECYSLERYSRTDFEDAYSFMNQQLFETDEFEMFFSHIFPLRRLISIASVFATSVVSGYNSMPTMMTPAKVALASVARMMGETRNERAALVTLSQEEFLKQLTENFPTSEDGCLEWPPGLEDFFKQFWEDLMRLIRQMPSIIFRGVANQLDPAYKEMRQHYMNCDIKNLTFRGLKPAGTGEHKLTNGLYLSGRSPLSIRQDVSGLQRKNKGRYVPLGLGIASDIGYAVGSLPNFTEFGIRLGIMTTKLVSYIYSGNQPFLDPSFYFKIPCLDIDEGAWRDYGKYDAGMYGRYGHPLSPFTLLALTTPQLQSDKNLKESNCVVEVPEEDCKPGEPVELVPEDQDTPVATEALPGDDLVPEGSTRPSQEVLDRQAEAIQAERDELQEYSDWYNSMTPEQKQTLLEAEIAEGEDTTAVSNEAECETSRKAIRIAINRVYSLNTSLSFDPNGPFAFQKRNELTDVTTEIKTLKAGLYFQGCRGTIDDDGQIRTKDVVTARFFPQGATTPLYAKQVEIPWRPIYQNNQIDGFFDFTNSSDYNNFGN